MRPHPHRRGVRWFRRRKPELAFTVEEYVALAEHSAEAEDWERALRQRNLKHIDRRARFECVVRTFRNHTGIARFQRVLAECSAEQIDLAI